MENEGYFDKHEGQLVVVVSLIILVLSIGLIFGTIWGGYAIRSYGKNFSRSQRLADERNQIQVNAIQIQQTEQLVKVAQQKADIKIQEAYGIAKSQQIINDTLTPQYLQHEAIQAQETQSNKIIYVPSGNQGIPLVQTTN